MSLLLKILRNQENISDRHKTRRLEQEALRKNENPEVYHVKQKLRNHPNPKYSSMSDKELTKEAIRLTEPDSLRKLFSELTHTPLRAITEPAPESTGESAEGAMAKLDITQEHLEKASQLTLKLHLSHTDDTPSLLTRLGAALLKVPYGVLHATLEIADPNNPQVSYMLEFNDSHLVQPRKKNALENSALEATIPLKGAKLKHLDEWQPPRSVAEMKLRKTRDSFKVGSERGASNTEQGAATSADSELEASDLDMHKNLVEDARQPKQLITAQQLPAVLEEPDTQDTSEEQDEDSSGAKTSAAGQASKKASTSGAENPHRHRPPLPYRPLPSAAPPVVTSHSATPTHSSHSEDLTNLLHISLSKMIVVEKLVEIIIRYNTTYYYHSITRNCQTFIVEVLQSLGVWKSFKLGDKLELYRKNLTKGKKEVYRSHKSVNDRVKYLIQSGEIEDTTYDDLRYLRSLYTIYHLEELEVSGASEASAVAVCSDPDCMLGALEEELKKKRPDDVTNLPLPEFCVQ